MRAIACAITVVGWLVFALYALRDGSTTCLVIALLFASGVTVDGVLDPLHRHEGEQFNLN